MEHVYTQLRNKLLINSCRLGKQDKQIYEVQAEFTEFYYVMQRNPVLLFKAAYALTSYSDATLLSYV